MIRSFVQEAPKTLAFLGRNANLWRRYMNWELVFISYQVVNTLTIAFIGVTMGKERVLFLVIGALLWGFLGVLFQETADAVTYERWEDTIEFTFAAPVTRVTYLVGSSSWAALYGLFRTLVLLAIVSLLFKLDMSRANLPAAMAVMIASTLSFVGLGMAAAALPLLWLEKGSAATNIFQTLLLLVSGVYYDISVLPVGLQWLSHLSPATYTLSAMRAALLQGASFGQVLPTIVALVGMGAITIPVGVWCFGAAERYAKRHGRLKRGG
jgi:ABC-2 type transport system permease protein